MRRSVVLVGLMGAGKTSVGRQLSDLLAAPFFDSDTEIETASAGMSIPEIFERYGEAEFRRLEREVLKRLLAGPPAVIATGGGAFMNEDTRRAVASNAVSVWLNVELPTLIARVANRPGRPLLANGDPAETLAGLLKERAPIYALADLTIAAGSAKNQETVAQEIIAAISKNDASQPQNAVLNEGGAS